MCWTIYARRGDGAHEVMTLQGFRLGDPRGELREHLRGGEPLAAHRVEIAPQHSQFRDRLRRFPLLGAARRLVRSLAHAVAIRLERERHAVALSLEAARARLSRLRVASLGDGQ